MFSEIAVQLILWSWLLPTTVLGQVKPCYRFDGTLAANPSNRSQSDVPCVADAEVSACCGVGSRCGTNLWCATDAGSIVGTCTDKTWTDPRCPLPLNSTLNPAEPVRFDYQKNTTLCADTTVCPGPGNTPCCAAKKGITEIFFQNPNIIPADPSLLPSYYSQGTAKTMTSTPVTPNNFNDTPGVPPAPTVTFLHKPGRPTAPMPTLPQDTRTSTLAVVVFVFSVLLIVGLIAALVWLRAMRRRRRRRQASVGAKIPDENVRLE